VKRDLDQIRQILLRCEQSPDRWFPIGILEENEYSGGRELNSSLGEVELFHIDLMADAGLIRKLDVDHPGIGYPEVAEVMYEITWAGYEHLDAVRDKSIWEKTKTEVGKVGGSVTLELAKKLATAFVRQKIEQQTGLKL
jgi:hypothetical protein